MYNEQEFMTLSDREKLESDKFVELVNEVRGKIDERIRMKLNLQKNGK